MHMVKTKQTKQSKMNYNPFDGLFYLFNFLKSGLEAIKSIYNLPPYDCHFLYRISHKMKIISLLTRNWNKELT